MNQTNLSAELLQPALPSAADEFLLHELRVARRADELARTYSHARACDYWMEAEAEVLYGQFQLTEVA